MAVVSIAVAGATGVSGCSALAEPDAGSATAAGASDSADIYGDSASWHLERVVSRGWLIDDLGAPVPGPRERVALADPFSLAAREAEIYIADRSLGAVLRYDVALDVLEPVVRAADCARSSACALAAAGNRMSYFAPGSGSGIAGIDWRGDLRRFMPYGGLVRIAGLGVDRRGDVHAIDLSGARTYRHSRDGALLGERELVPAPPARALAAWSGEGWWIVDVAAGTARAYEADGVARTEPRTLGIADVVAVAADEHGVLYVASGVDRTVHVLTPTGPRAIADADGRPHRFGPIAALAASGGRVHVACASPARVETWRRDAAR